MEFHTSRNTGPLRKSECKPNRARRAVKKGLCTIRLALPCGRTQERGSIQGRVERVCSRWSSFRSKSTQSTCHYSVTADFREECLVEQRLTTTGASGNDKSSPSELIGQRQIVEHVCCTSPLNGTWRRLAPGACIGLLESGPFADKRHR